ncbi:PREDICTED: uncharacterized protein LOC108662853 [Theobroma cacao]|uniref:Uncharacterized protein LOC108662853 n=1 Tax=Theobroma cacao TaxID=3641 RepID=A0AB32WR98_THECC|nr:PREDICTED: uncharacterized protein LOC108662853 [Theobroma cacao]
MQTSESGSRGQNVIVDMAEGSGEHSPMIENSASQTTSNNKIVSIVACSRDRMEAYAENPPNLESASEIEVYPRVRRRRHSNTEVSIVKIFSLASDKAVDMGENDKASDEDAISVNFAASWERERYF